VLGAGGAARAVVFGLIERGIKRVYLANRTVGRASRAKDQFGASVDPVSWDALGDLLLRAGLLVNTTSLGMHGQPPLEADVRPASAACGCRRPGICAAADAAAVSGAGRAD
jgi:shikimate dehydrogenase